MFARKVRVEYEHEGQQLTLSAEMARQFQHAQLHERAGF